METVTVNQNPPPDRPAYQTRVVDERNELAAKVAKLAAFINADPANGGAERELLGQQWMAMEAYLDALNRRIELWSA